MTLAWGLSVSACLEVQGREGRDSILHLFVFDTIHGAVETGVSRFLGLDGIAAYAQDDTDVGAVDECGSTTSADEWKRLPRHRDEAYSHTHVDHSL